MDIGELVHRWCPAQFGRPTIFAVAIGLVGTAAVSVYAEEADEAKYQSNCAPCHGPQMQGTGLGPPLSTATYRYGGRRHDIERVITNGIVSRGMPSFAKTLSAEDIQAIAALLPARQTSESEEAEDAEPPKERVFDAVPGAVDTLDYVLQAEVFVDGLKTPWAITFMDKQTALVTERSGNLRLITSGTLDERPIKGTSEVWVKDSPWNQGGLLDVSLDPDYANNGWIYLAYSHALPTSASNEALKAMLRVVRGRIRDHTWTDQQVVYEADHASYQPNWWHYGGRTVFDDKGRLYLSVGDRGQKERAQDLAQPNGKIHRVEPNGRTPSDNPFRRKKDALPSVFSYGHRNPQGLAIEPKTGQVWATEHGPRGGDELNILREGANYGWPVNSYGINYDGTILTPEVRSPGLVQPIYYWRPSIGVSGLIFYEGDEFPMWRGKLLVTGLASRQLRLLTLDGDRVLHEETIFRAEGRPYEPVVGPDGAIYLVTDSPGQILRLTAKEERRQ
ncbi:MAG: PQQ-dependent sugar dehydrogenase [Myxococcales bacterium]|nr:PQQ-dependent sugar dehydrogenase [Myxococcales bacterium]